MIAALSLCTLLCGCSKEDVYERARQNANDAVQTIKELGDEGPKGGSGASAKEMEENAMALAAEGTGTLSKASKKAGAIIIVTSEAIGILLFIVSSRAKAIKLKKSAIMTFIVGIPALTVVLIYGLALLATWFN